MAAFVGVSTEKVGDGIVFSRDMTYFEVIFRDSSNLSSECRVLLRKDHIQTHESFEKLKTRHFISVIIFLIEVYDKSFENLSIK